MTTSAKGRALIESFEGLRLDAYQDQGGVWTIGYGHTGPEVAEGLVWTQEQAEAALENDLKMAETAVNDHVTYLINQNQFDALVDFTFNFGARALEGSTLLRLLNRGLIPEAAAQFLRWDHVKGIEVPGLLRRRRAERDLFLEG